jgi:hypothetical protein
VANQARLLTLLPFRHFGIGLSQPARRLQLASASAGQGVIKVAVPRGIFRTFLSHGSLRSGIAILVGWHFSAFARYRPDRDDIKPLPAHPDNLQLTKV